MSDDGDRTDGGDPTDEDDGTDAGVSAAIGPTTLGGWLGYVVAPVAVGTIVYWFVSDATELDTVVFAAMMVGAVLAMDYFFDTIPE